MVHVWNFFFLNCLLTAFCPIALLNVQGEYSGSVGVCDVGRTLVEPAASASGAGPIPTLDGTRGPQGPRTGV